MLLTENEDKTKCYWLKHNDKYIETSNPYGYHLLKVKPWKIFGAVTFRENFLVTSSPKAQAIRIHHFKELIFEACKNLKLRPNKLLFYRKAESQNKRLHYHFLIAEQGTRQVSADQLADTLTELWPYGRADIQPFNPETAVDGISYTSKIEIDQNGPKIPEEYFSPRLEAKLKQLAKESEATTKCITGKLQMS